MAEKDRQKQAAGHEQREKERIESASKRSRARARVCVCVRVCAQSECLGLELTVPPSLDRSLRFLGRPHDLSPMARVRSLFYGDVPFDRHDWYVDRNGEEVRYVIDFYFDEEKAGTMEGEPVGENGGRTSEISRKVGAD